MALKVYFDGSRTEGRSMTLGCVALDERVLSILEPCWKETLSRHSAPPVHMKELMHLAGDFKGWTELRRHVLLDDLIHLLHQMLGEPRKKAFSCTVDLVAHTELKNQRRLPLPERLCTRIVFPRVYDWYLSFPEEVLTGMDVWFDQNEKFMHHIASDWRNSKIVRRYPAWRFIRTMAPGDYRLLVALQIAEMLAWSRNRIVLHGHEEMGPLGRDHLHYAYRITGCLQPWHADVDRKRLSEDLYPDNTVNRSSGRQGS